MSQSLGFPFDHPAHEARVLGAALAYLDWTIADVDESATRRARKERIVREKLDTLEKLGVTAHARDALGTHIRSSVSDWTYDQRTLLLIESCFSIPFAPYDVKCSPRQRRHALRDLALLLGLPGERVEQVLESIASARSAHKHIAWSKIALLTAVGASLGYVVAPVIGAALGTAAGLAGAAATAHGLALLGGGSLAAGGAGMVGGMWLVTGIGAATTGTGTFLFQLGRKAAVGELVKLQVSFREVILRNQGWGAKAAAAIEALVKQKEELEKWLEHEREMNERNARRVQEIERIVESCGDAIRWMHSQKAS